MTVVNMRALKRFWFNGMRDVNDQFDAPSRHARSLSAVGRGLYPGPSAFTFTDVTGAAPETVYVSNTITIAGLTVPTPLFIDGGGGSYSKNGGPYRSTPSTVVTGDTITVQITSSTDPETAVNAVVTIGGVSDTYTVTTTEGGENLVPLAVFNFKDGVYTVAGSTIDPTTVLLSLDMAHITPDVGLGGGVNSGVMGGSLLASLLPGFTVVGVPNSLEGGTSIAFEIYDDPDFSTDIVVRDSGVRDYNGERYDAPGTMAGFRWAFAATGIPGTRLAYVRSDDGVVHTIPAAAIAGVVNKIDYGLHGSGGAFVESITFYAPQDDSDLPVLSAL